jgi:hypothetical protein
LASSPARGKWSSRRKPSNPTERNKHKHTLPYTTTYDALPEHQRPVRIVTHSPNVNAVAETLIRERARIRAALGRR